MHGSQLNTVSRVHHTNSRAGVKNMPSVWKLLLAAALAVGVAGSAHADTEDGVRKWRVGDFAGAVAAWRGPATAGNSDAQFNLGQAYKLGRGVQADPAMAIEDRKSTRLNSSH